MERFFRAAGYLFTWRLEGRHARIDMWREGHRSRRYHVTHSFSPPLRDAVFARALALVGWVRSLGVRPRKSERATAVAESLAAVADRLGRIRCDNDPRVALAIDAWSEGRAFAA